MPKPYNPHDRLMVKAKQHGFRARSVYKLMELDTKFQLFKSGQKVLDVGAAPGSWLQYISQKIGPQGLAIGLDLQPISPISGNVVTLVSDLNNLDELNLHLNTLDLNKFDIVLSDIAPNTTGIYGLDHLKSVELSKNVYEISKFHLRKSGTLVMKIFQGEHLPAFIKTLKQNFGFVTAVKVKASRDRSREVYLVCRRKINEPQTAAP
jgi:23S rRNA (uridine2552-2'-O)-methyltransferase